MITFNRFTLSSCKHAGDNLVIIFFRFPFNSLAGCFFSFVLPAGPAAGGSDRLRLASRSAALPFGSAGKNGKKPGKITKKTIFQKKCILGIDLTEGWCYIEFADEVQT